MIRSHVTSPSTLPSTPYIDAAKAQAGMDVYSLDGKRLGIVREVWAHIALYGYVAKSRFALADFGPVRGTMHLFEGADGYVQITRRRGIAREGEQDMYIPLDLIHDAVEGEALVITEQGDACHAVFGARPRCLDTQR